MEVHPLEARMVEVHLIERGIRAIQPVQLAHQALQLAVIVEFQQLPADAFVVIPLLALPDLLPHEQQLLSRVRPHVSQKRADIGELPPFVAGHSIEQRSLAVDHLVVRNRQHEILREGVEQAERDVVVLILAVDRVVAEVVQHVVHPAHVPLHGEAQPVQVDRLRHAREGGGFLGHRERARHGVRQFVEAAQKLDGLQVLVAAVLIGNPLAGLARVVQVQHGGHRIHAQPVDVKFLQPEQRVRNQERAHFVAPVVEDQRAPVLLLALARIGVLVERRAVEVDQSVRVFREVRRHPIDDHADPRLVAGIDEELEFIGRTEPRGGREISDHLIAPRTRERILHHRQQLDVGVAHLLHVLHQLDRQFPVGQHLTHRTAHPAFQVNFVNRHRRFQQVGRGAGRHPRRVLPFVLRVIPDARRRFRRQFAIERVGIGLQLLVRREARSHVVLIRSAHREPGNEQLPDTAVAPPHGMAARVPIVELAGQRNRLRIRRPHRETHAR